MNPIKLDGIETENFRHVLSKYLKLNWKFHVLNREIFIVLLIIVPIFKVVNIKTNNTGNGIYEYHKSFYI